MTATKHLSSSEREIFWIEWKRQRPRQRPPSPSPPPGAHVRSCLRHSSRQVFGLAGFLLTPASQFVAEPVLNKERSFLPTAAGQFRIHTGFPFQLIEKRSATVKQNNNITYEIICQPQFVVVPVQKKDLVSTE